MAAFGVSFFMITLLKSGMEKLNRGNVAVLVAFANAFVKEWQGIYVVVV